VSADYTTKHFLAYVHHMTTDYGKDYLYVVWKNGPAIGALTEGELRELSQIHRDWLNDEGQRKVEEERERATAAGTTNDH